MGTERTTIRSLFSWVVYSLVAVFVVFASLASSCGKPKPRNLGGEIHGFVSSGLDKAAGEGNRTAPPIRLPDIKVTAKNIATNAVGAPVTTNANGHFILPRLATGQYQLCVDGPGFIASCDPTTLTVASETIVLNFDVFIAPQPGVIRGRVLLDGPAVAACYVERQMFNTLVTGRVWLTNGSGTQVAGPVRANAGGEFVLPKIPAPGSYHLRASCENGEADQAVTFSAADLATAARVNVTIKNRPPIAGALAPTIAGKFVNRADAGSVVKVSVQATDPDGDTLHYKWASDTPGFTSADAATIDWQLPMATAVNVISVQISDGKGGYAFRSARVESGPNQVRFGGIIRDRSTGAVLSGADVSLRTFEGASLGATSDANGAFGLAVPQSVRYVLNVNKIGYALVSRIFSASATGLDLLLDPAQMATFPGDRGGSVTFERQNTATVKIGPGTLVDAKGNTVAGQIRGYAFAYDLERSNPIPGDLSAKTMSGRDVRLESYGAVDLTFTDGAGNRLQLAPGATADVALSIHPASLATAKSVIPMLRYDEPTGYWIEVGEFHRNGNRYEGKVSHLSAFNADTVFTNTACLQFNVADHDVPPFPFVLHMEYTSAAGGPRHNDFQITQTNNGLMRLPPDTPLTITLYPGSGPGAPTSSSPHVLGTFHWNSGHATGNDTYPVADLNICNGFDTAPLPSHPAKPADVILTSPSHDTFITGFSAGTQMIADAYYASLGVVGGTTRNNFLNWKATNGFNADPAVAGAAEGNAQYFNNGDLQLGRDMHCLTNVSGGRTKVACYVSNYGNGALVVQGDPQFGVQTAVDHSATPAATVAMEFDDQGMHPPPIDAVQFYVYKGDNSPFQNPGLDSEGNKFLPQNCMACHGGNYNSTTNRVEGASFLAFDVFSFIYDNRAAKHKSLEDQQEAFRKINSMVKASKPNNTNPNDPIVSFIDGLYSGCNVDTAGCRAQNGPTAAHPGDGGPFTPSGWQTNAMTTALYQTIPRAYCRTCHLAQGSVLAPDWTAFTQMTNSITKSQIQFRVCVQTEPSTGANKLMPHAEVPYKQLWFSSNPSGPAFLGDPTTGIGLTANASGDRCPR